MAYGIDAVCFIRHFVSVVGTASHCTDENLGSLSIKIITDVWFGEQRSLKPPISYDISTRTLGNFANVH